jgi:hypothetical protein
MSRSPAYKFKENSVDFIEFLTDVVRELKQSYNIRAKPEDLEFTCLFIKAFNMDALIDSFIYGSRTQWDHILAKNESYFTKDFGEIFKFLEVPNKDDYINQLLEVLTTKKSDGKSYIVGNKDREIVWNYLHSFVKLSIQYFHEQSGPTIQNNKTVYTKPMYTDIDIQSEATKWGVKLSITNNKHQE